MANRIKTIAVDLDLDRKRSLKLDFNCWCELHDQTGITPEEGFQFDKPEAERKISLKFIRDLVWAGLLSGADENETPLTRKQVGDLIGEYGMEYVSGKLNEAFFAANGDPQKPNEKPLENTESPLALVKDQS